MIVDMFAIRGRSIEQFGNGGALRTARLNVEMEDDEMRLGYLLVAQLG